MSRPARAPADRQGARGGAGVSNRVTPGAIPSASATRSWTQCAVSRGLANATLATADIAAYDRLPSGDASGTQHSGRSGSAIPSTRLASTTTRRWS